MSAARTHQAVRNHERVYQALRRAGAPRTAYQLLEEMRADGISAPPTVYRALERLVRDGSAHRLESLNAYVACSSPGHRHDSPVFVICGQCGSIAELVEPRVTAALRRCAVEAGFVIDHATVELTGRCAACQMEPSAP